MVERKAENLEVISSSLILDIYTMRFNMLYKYLRFQVFTPSLKHKCRVWVAKDQRYYNKEYWNVMQELNGSYWSPILQNIDVDGFLYKKYLKISVIIIFILFLVYCLCL